VQSPPTNCPRCEGRNPFRPQRRAISDNRIEVYIRCPTCNWESILRVSTPEIERLYRLKSRWEGYARATVSKHGVRSSMATVHLKRLRERIRELQDDIH